MIRVGLALHGLIILAKNIVLHTEQLGQSWVMLPFVEKEIQRRYDH